MSTRTRRTWGRVDTSLLRRWLLVGLAFGGFLVALYLTFMHYRGIAPSCYVVQGCSTVQTSRYAVPFLGIPMALYGTVYFAVLFHLGVAVLAGAGGRAVVTSFKILAYAGALAAIPLFLLQAVVLRAFCFYCLVTEAILLALWLASLGLRGDLAADAATSDARCAWWSPSRAK